jgi:membrane associated rhomboid family serine protease
VVIGYLGSLSFVIVYFGSLVCGSLLTILFHKDDYNYRAVGASGAVTGVLYSAILQPDMMLSIFYNSYAIFFWNPLFTVFYLRNES